jgi:hypothetical protein
MKYLFRTKSAVYRAAFWGGFWEGASAASLTYTRSRCYEHVGNLKTAWTRVGDYIYQGIAQVDSEVQNKAKGADQARPSKAERVA